MIMGQWTRVENNNEVFLRVTNHTGFFSTFLYLSGMVRHSEKHLIIIDLYIYLKI